MMGVRVEPTVEVCVARPPSIFVRELTGDESVRLRRMSRQSKVFALRQRATLPEVWWTCRRDLLHTQLP